MTTMSADRMLCILQDFVNHSLGCSDAEWVRLALVDVCGMTKEEIIECGLDYIFPDIDDWFEDLDAE